MTNSDISRQQAIEKRDAPKRRAPPFSVFMSPEQLREFDRKMKAGFCPFPERLPRKEPQPQEPTPMDVVDLIQQWLGETLDEGMSLSNRDYADQAARELLNLPCSSAELRSFFLAYAQAFEMMLCIRVQISAESRLTGEPDRMSLGMASSYPEWMTERLRRLSIMTDTQPDCAQIFRLYEFAGSTAEEIAELVNLPLNEVEDHLANGQFDVKSG
ncbi:hypothetical protein [Blastopirellula marina]|uniref:Uncharacterized protein n=1 Tax=Blastopirellula marina DSM 3645 TaxID=314230 RepID=A3ZMU6_9BACT|nr:hypothetical protein [Blastopirellula marina]EAQ82272.1 hypothetical protein DSM3645_01120 [Blastopirellula marina DSM 3645]